MSTIIGMHYSLASWRCRETPHLVRRVCRVAEHFPSGGGYERATILFVTDPWEDGDQHINLEDLRARIRSLSDVDLLRYVHDES